MRRSACLLALLGMTVQGAVGDDAVSSAGNKASAPRTLQFFTAKPDAAGTASPQKYSRTPATETPATETSTSEAPAGAVQLAGQGVDLTPGGTTMKLKAAVQPDVAEESGVVHASFDNDSAQPNAGQIEQVRAERFGNPRPFPGTSPQVDSGTTPARASLTDPISIPGTATGTPQTAAAPQAQSSRGSVNFIRSTAPAAAAPSQAQSPPATPAAVQAAPASPNVSVEWRKQSDINVGQECRCQLIVKNTGSAGASAVELKAQFPGNVRLVSAAPMPARAESFLGWDFAELKAGEQQVIEIVMVPLQRGAIETRADVRYSSTVANSFTVSEPLLAVEIEGAPQVLIGEPASQTVTVTNPGTGVATNVQIEAVIPAGLEHARGERLVMELGSLNPGESRSVRLALAAAKGGRHIVHVQARADAGLVRNTSAEVTVIAPSLQAGIDGPGLRYLGRQGTFTLSVANDGTVPTDNVRVMHKIPEGFQYVGSDRGAQYDPATRLLTWFVGRLDKGQTASMKVTLSAQKIGEFQHLVRATSETGSLSDVQLRTAVEGTSSLAMHVRDLEDPVEVGAQNVYEVVVKNDGSAAAKNIGIACELAPGMTFESAEGPAQHIVDNGVVVFRALPEIAPGQSAVFRVKVSVANPGSLRFRARLTSDSIEEPLTTEELTKFYGE